VLQRFVAILAIAAAMTMAAPTNAAETNAFFAGKTVRILVGFSAGGGYDVYARELGRYLGRHIPGNPAIAVQNMAGAGSLKAVNYLYNAAPRDGTVLATFARGIVFEPLIGHLDGAQFEAPKFNWIGSPSSEVSLAISWHDSGIDKFEDLRTRGMTAATSGPGSDGNIYGRVLNTILGTKIKTVTGYQGSAQSMLAIERREVDGATSVSYAAIKSMETAQSPSGKKPNRFRRV